MVKGRARRILLPLLLILAIALFFLLQKEDKNETTVEIEADLVFKKTSLKFSQDGRTIAEFEVGLLMQNENENVIYFEKIDNAKLYDKEGIVLAFSADKGIYYEKRNEFALTGNVRIFEGDSNEPITVVERVTYDSKTSEAIINERSEVRLRNRRILSDRIVGNVNERRISLTGNVVIEMAGKERITCDEAVYHMDDGVFEIIGNAEMEFNIDI